MTRPSAQRAAVTCTTVAYSSCNVLWMCAFVYMQHRQHGARAGKRQHTTGVGVPHWEKEKKNKDERMGEGRRKEK